MKRRLFSLLIGCLAGLVISIYGANQSKTEIVIEKQSLVLQEAAEIKDVPKVEEVFFDVPLSEDLQRHIFSECEKANIAPELILAMIEQESNYNADTIGDGGKSFGLLQVQAKWHQERMERLRCTDLSDPYQNVTVAVDYLLELFHINEDVYWVLMAYNGGQAYATEHWEEGNYSDYALEVSERSMELERERELYQCDSVRYAEQI